MSTIAHIFNSLADRADAPGLLDQMVNRPDIQTRAYYDMPAIIPGTSAGAFAVNDICNRMLARGADPRYLGATFSVDPDMVQSKLRYIASHTAEAAVAAEVEFASVDTAIIDTGLPCGFGVSLTAVGAFRDNPVQSPACIKDGDIVIMTGRAGAHGIALYEALNHSLFIPPVLSDSASLGDVVHAIRDTAGLNLRTIYYPADGLLSAINAIEKASGRHIRIQRDNVPVSPIVAAAAHAIGRSHLSLATAGAMIAIVDPSCAEQTLANIRRSDFGRHAAVIGTI